MVQGREVLRASFLNHATSTDDVDRIVPAVPEAAAGLGTAGR